jgi:hypothetical protein
MQCENRVPALGAYFLQGRIVHVPCNGVAAWEISVNPPTAERTGKVRLCDHCNKFDYLSFPRSELTVGD